MSLLFNFHYYTVKNYLTALTKMNVCESLDRKALQSNATYEN